MKKRATTLLLGLTGISILTVGFSAWIITGLAGEKSAENITVNVAEAINSKVEFKSLKIVDPIVKFEPLNNYTGGVFDKQTQETEDMVFGVNFTLGNALNSDGLDFTDYMKTTKLEFEFTCSKQSEFNSVTTSKYIISPLSKSSADDINFSTAILSETTTVNYEISGETPQHEYLKKKVILKKNQTTNNDLDVELEYGFGWGEFFNFRNPSELKEASEATDYINALNDLKTKLNGSTFTLKIIHSDISTAA